MQRQGQPINHPDRRPSSAMLGSTAFGSAILASLFAAFILYGSLYPFRFQPRSEGTDFAAAVGVALARPSGGHDDLLANLLLYMPLGLLVGVALARLRAAPMVLLTTSGAAALSASVEVAQLYIAGRWASGWDLLLNVGGGALGAGVALAIRAGRLPRTSVRPVVAEPFALLLVACWLAYRLYPYVPTLELSDWRASLRPLLYGNLEPWRALRFGLFWLVAARLLEAAVPGRAAWLVCITILGTTAAAVPIVERVLAQAELLGGALGLVGWAALRFRSAWIDRALLLLLLAAVVAEALAPFRLAEEARAFGWIPFRAALGGQWGTGLQALLLKFFLSGALFWLALRAGLARLLAAILAVLTAFALSLAQSWTPSRSAEITDTLLALGAILTWALLRRDVAAAVETTGWQVRR